MKSLSRLFPILITVSSFILSACNMPVVDNNDAKRAQKLLPISYVQLTTEKSHPIIKNPMLGHIKPEVLSAVNKFPTTRDCLIESEKTSDTPDLRLIDWKSLNTRSELDVCLARIFKSLKTFQSIKSWMSFHYLNAPHGNPEHKFRSQKRADGSIVLTTTFEWRRRLPFRDTSPVPRIVGGPYKVRVGFNSSNGKPTSVNGVSSDWARQM